METNVYIDGFNFYYGVFKRNSDDPERDHLQYQKWVDLRCMTSRIFPRSTIADVYYFTARVEGDPGQALRQNVYLRALESVGVQSFFGTFKPRTRTGPLVGTVEVPGVGICVAGIHPGGAGTNLRRARDTPLGLVEIPELGISTTAFASMKGWEEKGSDVHLAARLVADAIRGRFEQAMVISNDADLAPAIALARRESGLRIHVASPRRKIPAELRQAATSAFPLKRTVIPDCQLPSNVVLADGTVLHRPREWTSP